MIHNTSQLLGYLTPPAAWIWTLTRLTYRELVAATPSLGPTSPGRWGDSFMCGMMWGVLGMTYQFQILLPVNVLLMPTLIRLAVCYTGNGTGLKDRRPSSHASSFLLLLSLSSRFLLSFLLLFLTILATPMTQTSILFFVFILFEIFAAFNYGLII